MTNPYTTFDNSSLASDQARLLLRRAAGPSRPRGQASVYVVNEIADRDVRHPDHFPFCFRCPSMYMAMAIVVQTLPWVSFRGVFQYGRRHAAKAPKVRRPTDVWRQALFGTSRQSQEHQGTHWCQDGGVVPCRRHASAAPASAANPLRTPVGTLLGVRRTSPSDTHRLPHRRHRRAAHLPRSRLTAVSLQRHAVPAACPGPPRAERRLGGGRPGARRVPAPPPRHSGVLSMTALVHGAAMV